MTTQGESRPIAGSVAEGQGHGGGAESRRSRRVFTWCATVLVLGAAGFVVTRPHPGDWLPGLGPTSKDAPPPVVGSPPPTSSTDPNPFTAEQYFPAARPIDLNGFKAKRSGARQGNDCTETLQDPTKDVLRNFGCQGYLTVTFTRADGKVLSCVTVLRFADDQTGQQVADLLAGKPGALKFVLPDTTIAAPSASAGAVNSSLTRVEDVHHYVTVTTSRFTDGHSGTGPNDPDLEEATRAVSYVAGEAFMWG
ncbi:hypothetical protein ACIGXM_30325 [Kitasatospora sp. NPDC052896]|uniref:hypothetical protein n=1 Tax=Kitasatospora sp. NPDC052896 TaxID=3364061 RepID=UPI0037C880B3